jgi:hypothetical protein
MLRGASCYRYGVGRIDWSISDLIQVRDGGPGEDLRCGCLQQEVLVEILPFIIELGPQIRSEFSIIKYLEALNTVWEAKKFWKEPKLPEFTEPQEQTPKIKLGNRWHISRHDNFRNRVWY